MSIRKYVAIASPVLLATGAVVCVGASLLLKKVLQSSERATSRPLEGKVVVITGGSRGLGLALAEQFGRSGARLALAARDSEELDRALAYLLKRRAIRDKSDVELIACDLTDNQQAQEMIARATGRFGRVDVLINNAGIITVGPVENQPLSAFQAAMNGNYYTMLQSTLAVLPQMLARRDGAIVNITSIGGKMAVPHLLPYSASKFAAVGFSQGLHSELRSKGVRVTTVCPGLMRTGSHLNAQFTGDQQAEYRWFSLGASLPGLSASAACAAKKIVRATIRGATEITITPQAFIAARLAQLSPECTAGLMHLANTLLLPQANSHNSSDVEAGKNFKSKEWKSATILGNRAAERYNQKS